MQQSGKRVGLQSVICPCGIIVVVCTSAGNCQRSVLCRGIDQEALVRFRSLRFISFRFVPFCSTRFFLNDRQHPRETINLVSWIGPGHGYFSTRNKHPWKTYCYKTRLPNHCRSSDDKLENRAITFVRITSGRVGSRLQGYIDDKIRFIRRAVL